MAYERITLEIADGVAMLTLNHPQSRNALAWAMADEIADALDRLGNARALVITGAGKAFCSGGDMAMAVPAGQTMGDEIKRGLTENVNPMLLKLRALDIPVIAAVNGAAAGAGAPLALSADLVIAGESAFFFMAFPNVGLVPDAGGTYLLPRLIGTPRAMQMMMLAEKIGAAQALDWGMIYKVVADDMLLAEAQALAARLAKGPTVSYGLIRRNVSVALESDYASSLALEAEGQRIAGGSADCAEAVSAFLEKRAPDFQGK
ncbi:MAG: enoyl-CoA hydratase/isomerase family protein [Sphingomonadales bacterium]|nr:enoyl-CoA hydratase/isomerase family protein [Sphingomonadales bacterium]